MKILLTGANGYIGSLLTMHLKDRYQFIGVDQKDLNLADVPEVYNYFKNQDFDVCFHMAANAQTQACEEQPELTHKINVEAAIEIAKVCKEKSARLIFFSTEQVFNDQDNAPFSELDQPKSVSKYGLHKLEVEEYIQANLTNYVIMRLSWQFGLSSTYIKASPGIVKNVMNAMFFRIPTNFTLYEYRGMTYAYNLVKNFDKLLNMPSGILHFSSINQRTTYDSARYIATKLGYEDSEVEKYILADPARYADKPRDYRLANEKALSLGFELTSFEDDVDNCLKDFGY